MIILSDEDAKLIKEALKHSVPVAAHYPEPVGRHAKAMNAIEYAIISAEKQKEPIDPNENIGSTS